MAAELAYFFSMVGYGVVVSVAYHLLLYLRAVLRHGISLVDAEDILFLAGAGLGFFWVAYEKNDGILRWYAFAGAGLGCFAYVRTLGQSLEAARKWLLQKQQKAVKMKKRESEGQVSPNERNQNRPKKRKKKKRS